MSVPSTGWVPVDGGATREVGLSMSSEIGPSRGGWRGKIRGSFHEVGPSPDGAACERGDGETAAGWWWRACPDSRAREVGSRYVIRDRPVPWRVAGQDPGFFHGVGPSPDGAARERDNGETVAGQYLASPS